MNIKTENLDIYELIEKLNKLVNLHKQGKLGGEFMPEDQNPQLELASKDNFAYFTLPMALNYQRNSYNLWKSATQTYYDENTRDVFDPTLVLEMSEDLLREKLVLYGVAVQPQKQPLIWLKLCETFSQKYDGDIRNFLADNDFNVNNIKQNMLAHKKEFPYLSGEKIMNYWLYVLSNYTSAHFKDPENISIAPDTHVLQSSVKLGVITEEDLNRSDIREYTSECWKAICNQAGMIPIDLHTPLWLWSRSGFDVEL